MLVKHCWRRVRRALPPCDVEEIEQAKPKTLAEYVTLAENVRDRERSNAHAWTLWRDALSEWVREQEDAAHVVRLLAHLDHQLGVWCACKAARTALSYVLEGEQRPRRAIETTERWVCGSATAKECSDAAVAAGNAAYVTTNAAHIAAAHAANATGRAAIRWSDYATDAVQYAAGAVAREGNWDTLNSVKTQRLRELCVVVADAIITMPWEEAHDGKSVRALGARER